MFGKRLFFVGGIIALLFSAQIQGNSLTYDSYKPSGLDTSFKSTFYSTNFNNSKIYCGQNLISIPSIDSFLKKRKDTWPVNMVIDSGVPNFQNNQESLMQAEISTYEKQNESFKQSSHNFNLIAAVLGVIIVFLSILLLVFKKKNSRLSLNKENLKHQLKESHKTIAELKIALEHSSKEIKSHFAAKTDETKKAEQEKQKIKSSVIKYNKLSIDELLQLTKQNSHRWVGLGYSATGAAHLKSNPSIPCQDNHFYEVLKNGWNLSIVCDGAGSAKYSHFGSEFLAKKAIPSILEKELTKKDWYVNQELPDDNTWNKFALNLLRSSYIALKEWIEKEEDDHEIREYACTVILSLHNERGCLVANIGDGRGGYLNTQGSFKSLFIPYRGEESNATVFITSPIWHKPEDYIKTDVIYDQIISLFLLSDGLEKVSFDCSKMDNGVWVDPNIPYRDFFFPVIEKVQSTSIEQEGKLQKMWEQLLENGTDAIKEENDDKTMIIWIKK